jgi:ABC-type branched-subunit amino acid transport system ATPase component/branched-subunit amino acid ABC-type transport system permease component
VSQFLVIVVSGLVTGAIYSIFASGITLIYSTSGIYCLAFGSFAFMGMLSFYELSAYLPRGVAFVLTVVVISPLSGLVLERVVFRWLAQGPESARIIGSVGLLSALPPLGLEVVNQLAQHQPGLKLRPVTDTYSVPGIGPVPAQIYHLGNGTLNSDQLIVLAATAVAVAALWAVIRFTRIGLMTRAVVDRRELASLRGINPVFTSRVSWSLGSGLAGLAGVLAGPLFGLDTTAMLQFVVAGSAVVVVGRFRSLPVAVCGGLALGALSSVVTGYATDVPGLANIFTAVPGLQQAVIYVVLLAALFWRGRQRIRVAGVTVIERLTADYGSGLPAWRRWWPWVALVAALAIWTTGAVPWSHVSAGPVELQLLIQCFGAAIIFLSFTVLVGVLGVAGLAQAAVATTGALMAGLIVGHHVLGGNFLAALVIGVLAATVLAVIVAIPAQKLGGLALALATLALGFIGDTILFQLNWFDNDNNGWILSRPTVWGINFGDNRTYAILVLVVLLVCMRLVSNFQRSRIGRAAYATRFAPHAASSVGLSNRKSILVTFAFSGALAGLGGILLAYGNGNVVATSWPTLTGLSWIMIAMIQGVRRPGAALLGGLGFGLTGQILAHGFWGLTPDITDPAISTILFGLGCIVLATQPDGMLHAMSKTNHLLRQRWRKARGVTASVPPAVPAGGTGPPGSELVSEGGVASGHAPLPGGPGHGLVEIRGLCAGYGDSPVLHGIDLAVPEGTTLAVLGPNGAGKSTLCGAIAGLVRTTAGTIIFNGEDITVQPAHRRVARGLLLAPESRGIFPNLDVKENLAVALSSATDRKRALKRFPQLEARADLTAGNLSGGEQQMLCLAPLLIRPPRLLIVDEITLGLAPAIVREILDHLKELSAAGVTILMVEEKARHIVGIADYGAFLSSGRITRVGPISEFDEAAIAESYLGELSTARVDVEQGTGPS